MRFRCVSQVRLMVITIQADPPTVFPAKLLHLNRSLLTTVRQGILP